MGTKLEGEIEVQALSESELSPEQRSVLRVMFMQFQQWITGTLEEVTARWEAVQERLLANNGEKLSLLMVFPNPVLVRVLEGDVVRFIDGVQNSMHSGTFEQSFDEAKRIAEMTGYQMANQVDAEEFEKRTKTPFVTGHMVSSWIASDDIRNEGYVRVAVGGEEFYDGEEGPIEDTNVFERRRSVIRTSRFQDMKVRGRGAKCVLEV